jgi:uncharacterized LabA/DUF88 family protein
MSAAEPAIKRAVAFIDGQNLYRAAKTAFGYYYPNYDVGALAAAVCKQHGWQLEQVRFYTGIPEAADQAFWNHFWNAKLGRMGRQGIHVYSRTLRYRNQTVKLPDGSSHAFLVGQEKGVDVRLALDVVGMAYQQACDVLLLFSQDQDLSEVADEIRDIGRTQNRWLKIASAFPVSPTSTNRRGINGTDWIRIERATYDTCIDPRDYRPKPKPGGP